MIATKSKYVVFGPRKMVYILIAIVLMGLGIWLAGQFSKIDRLHCTTQFGPCPEHYLTRLGFLIGTSWYRLPAPDTVLPYLSSYVEVGDLTFRRMFPRQVQVEVTLRRAVGVVNNLLADEKGVVFGTATDTTLPKLNSLHEYAIGNTLSPSEVKGLDILGQLSTTVSHRVEGSMQRSVLTTTIDGVQVLFDVENNPENWNEALQLILARSKIDGNAPRRVDLRFNNPIIQY